MTRQARRLLAKMKKAQGIPDGTVYIDFDKMTVAGVHAKGEDFVRMNLKQYKGSIHTALQYLQDQGYIEYSSRGYAQVLHAGWHVIQTEFTAFSQFLFKSILVPVAVSLLTTVLIRIVEAFL